jgi:hypothetical protein
MADSAWTWTDAGGTVTQLLDGTDAFITPGVVGRMYPSILMTTNVVPLQPGQRFQQVTMGTRIVKAPLEIFGASPTALRTSIRAWVYRLDPTRGDGILTITAPGGDTRQLICRYAGGLEQGTEDETDVGNRFRATLTFAAEWPYWQDTADTVAGPLVLNSLLQSMNVGGIGDGPIWPVWTITGPLTSINVNISGNIPVAWGLATLGLTAGQSVVVDTRPNTNSWPNGKTIVKNDGTNLFGHLTAGSQLFPIGNAPGFAVQIAPGGYGAGTSIQCNYRASYLSA